MGFRQQPAETRHRCLEPFYKLLPSDLNDLSSASPNFGLQKTDNFTVVDGLSHKVLGTTSAKFVGEARLSIFVSRNKFRQLLSRNLKINYGKQFLSYEEDHEGVTALFGDGTVARGDILLGADGSNSSVRSQLLRGFQASPSAFLMFHGDVVLSKLQYEPLLEHSSCGILTGGSRVKIYLLLMEFLENETALFNWNVSWQSNDLEADQAWAQAASQESLLEKSVKIIQGYPPYVVQAIEQTKSQNVQKPPIKLIETLLPPHGLPKGRVSLLGDAAHSMVCSNNLYEPMTNEARFHSGAWEPIQPSSMRVTLVRA